VRLETLVDVPGQVPGHGTNRPGDDQVIALAYGTQKSALVPDGGLRLCWRGRSGIRRLHFSGPAGCESTLLLFLAVSVTKIE
jgi:hypothetical protein